MPRCPICHGLVNLKATPTVPFCSDRCRTIDLGRWLDESYSVPVPRGQSDDDGDGEGVPPDPLEPDGE